jgi:hypothetical protein
MASSTEPHSSTTPDYLKEGWEAALRELQRQAAHLEARGAVRAAVTLYDAIRIVRAHGPEGSDATTG